MSKAKIPFKKLLADYLQKHIENQTLLDISWDCAYCYYRHSGNLFKKVKSISIDYLKDLHKADIALFDANNDVFAVINISKNKKPDMVTANYYDEQRIIYIQIKPPADENIEALHSSIAKPGFIGTCFNPRCNKCGHFQQKTKMTIIDGPCWKCDNTMKIAVLEGGMERGASSVGPEEFTAPEITFARAKGVLIEQHYSKTRQEKYLANTCATCHTFAGSFYLFTQYLNPALMGDYPHEIYDMGYHCDHCYELAMDINE